MADELEEIKKRIDIVSFISEYIPLKKAGRNFRALCPFHSEKTPSFIVSPERQIWHCFGSCGTGGDIFGFLMRQENLEFGEALRILAQRAGVKLASYRPSPVEKQKQLLYEVNDLTCEFFHYLLISHKAGKKALNYILGRGISRASLVKFKLGYSPNMWDGLQRFLVGKKGYPIDILEKAGLVIKREKGVGYYDRFRNRLMFPLKDHRSNVCGFAGRVLDPSVEEAKYINTSETPIYHKSELLYGLDITKEAIKKNDGVVIVEGELDVISSYQVGVENVVAIKGSALTTQQAQLLARFTKNIILALDNDPAGLQAAKRGIEMAESAGMAIRAVAIRGGKDPDEVAQKNPALWQQLVSKATPIYDFLLSSACQRFNPELVEGKRKIGQEIIPFLAKINDQIVQSHYLKRLAEKLGVEKEAIAREISKFNAGLAREWVSQPAGGQQRLSRQEILERHLLALCFQSGHWSFLRKRKILSLIKVPRFVRILQTLAEYLRKYKTNKSSQLAKMLPAELRETFDQFYLLDLADLFVEEEGFKIELAKVVYQLSKLNLKQNLSQLAAKIKLAEEQKKAEEAGRLSQEFRDLSLQFVELEREEENEKKS